MKLLYRLDIKLTLLGPILTRGSIGPPGIDAAVARDAAGQVMLPFSLVKGKVLDALKELFPTDPRIGQWLGNPSSEGSYDPDRGRLHFSDFATTQNGCAEDKVIERIELDDATGSTTERMLAMIESPFAYGEEVVFTGNVEFAADPREADTIRNMIEQALRWVPAFGAMRSVGFGRTKNVEVKLVKCVERCSGVPTNGERLRVRLKLDRPFCVGGRNHALNHFDSLRTLSGAVLKGACARLLLERCGRSGVAVDNSLPAPWDQMGSVFDVIRFSEARPANLDGPRPIEPPLSQVLGEKGGTRHDVALWSEPRLINGNAPAFDIDWKGEDFARCRKDFHWPDVSTERRTRTAINEETGRAKDEQLFSYGLIRPGDLVWLGEIDLVEVPQQQRGEIRKRLQELLTFGLPGIGKTNATASIEWLPAEKMEPVQKRDNHVITLQTEALLTDPGTLTGPDQLEAAYREYWAEVSKKSLKLVRFFARQELRGGKFLGRSSASSKYEPFLVTSRGSVFVLERTGHGDPLEHLSYWREHGLPVANWVAKRYSGSGPLWRRCPFLPHVGYGEVLIDHKCHFESLSNEAQK